MQAIIFDMDGLMIDTEKLYFECERELASQYQKKVKDSTLWKMMGRSPLESISIFIEELKLPVNAEDLLKTRDEMMVDKYRKELVPMKGLFEIIEQFYGQLKLAIATGSKKEFLDIVVDQLKIRERFSVLQTSDHIKKGKPDPEIYLAAVKKLGLKAEECIVLEDSHNGALAGKNAGCYTIGVQSDYNREQNFDFVHYFASDLLDAAGHIKTLL